MQWTRWPDPAVNWLVLGVNNTRCRGTAVAEVLQGGNDFVEGDDPGPRGLQVAAVVEGRHLRDSSIFERQSIKAQIGPKTTEKECKKVRNAQFLENATSAAVFRFLAFTLISGNPI